MRFIFLLSVTCIFTYTSFAQDITGKVVCSANGKPLEYVSIGIVNEPIGTITNERGYFKLSTNGLASNKIVRFSMIGYKPQTFTIAELLADKNQIKLEEEPFEIKELVFTSRKGKTRKVGTSGLTRLAGVSGWGGTQFGSGHEIGTKIYVGDSPIKVKSIHIRLHSQSFDSTYLRLHIRDILDNLPKNHLLRENILLTLSHKSGWVEIDLSDYNIILKEEIALTLEWINVYGVNYDRLVRVNRSKEPTANVIFNVRRKSESITYVKRGSEGKWMVIEGQSPSIYLTVIE